MGSASAANKDSLLLGSALLVPVGGSPAGTGGSPVLPILQTRSKSVFGNCVLGSTGHWPVPSGDSPDGMVSASAANKDSLLLGSALLVPVGGSPTGTGGSPVLPNETRVLSARLSWQAPYFVAGTAFDGPDLGAVAESRLSSCAATTPARFATAFRNCTTAASK